MPSAHGTLVTCARLPITEALTPIADRSAAYIEEMAEAAGVVVSADVLWAMVIGGSMQRALAAELSNDQLAALGATLGPMGALLAHVRTDPEKPSVAEQIVILGVAVLARRILAGDL